MHNVNARGILYTKTNEREIIMNTKVNYKTLAISILIPRLIGGLSALLTMGSMKDFEALRQPPLSPPAGLFPVVWTILYVLMGVASYVVVKAAVPAETKRMALKSYFLQLFFNFMWSIIFFSFGAYEIAFAWLIALLSLIVLTAVRFFGINRLAGLLMLPYILWVLFAGYLNLAFAYLN